MGELVLLSDLGGDDGFRSPVGRSSAGGMNGAASASASSAAAAAAANFVAVPLLSLLMALGAIVVSGVKASGCLIVCCAKGTGVTGANEGAFAFAFIKVSGVRTEVHDDDDDDATAAFFFLVEAAGGRG